MKLQPARFCFCTLAFGKNYRNLALLLAKDLEKYSSETTFIVLTDEPRDFSKQPNVLAFKHQQQSVKLYHDKRFAIAKGLSLFDSCIFLDADMRILAPVTHDMEWITTPGINARGCEMMSNKYAKVFSGGSDSKLLKEFKVTKNLAKKLNLELDSSNVNFVYEYLFAVTKDEGKEIEFLKQWDTIAAYYELNGVYEGEGNAIGIAAAQAGLPVRWCAMDGINFFKDRTELIRVKKGQSNMQDMKIYFEQQRKLEYPQHSLMKKLIIKIRKQILYFFYLLRLRIVTLKNFEFYYR
ncbi:hypothetical protein H6G76_28760 [Nostoc sp. FACHB-152]|uniref:hypothetical protein n=1 Tax=unclassified Nostoc TaxID=2593658 RepID=UPI001688DEFF|nr:MULTISPECIES: hypothetical protein [unclassified Nostoc]MBD2451050.1 hypothetical protein [Nostoc sp. FACHB-152]MBD2471088.1 hypothetical protein [Nostoc sp. FACHB-145]